MKKSSLNPNHPKKIFCVFAAGAVLMIGGCGGGGNRDDTSSLHILQQPTDQSVVQGGEVTFLVSATGNGTVNCQWQVSQDKGVSWSNISGANSCSYTISAVSAALNGEWLRVKLSDTSGDIRYTSAVTLTVTSPAVPAITVQPAATTVTAGQTAVLSVTAAGTPTPSYQWQTSTDGGITWTNISGATSATYTTPVTATGDSGQQFRVKVSNSQGSVTSSAVQLTVNPAPMAPSISSQPTASVSVAAPSPATFTVVADGTAPLSYQWQLSTNAGSSWADISGATAASYTTAATTAADSGKRYRVKVSNAQGTVTSSASVLTVNTMLVAPSISTQPGAANVTAPDAATFSVTASGTPTPSYQWQLSTDSGTTWSNINGATAASYTTPATATSDSGKKYRVVVSNSQGSVISAAVGLTVGINTTPVSARRLSVGFGYALMVKADGTVLSTGTNMQGGSGPLVSGTAAYQVNGVSNMKSISASNGFGMNTSFNVGVRNDAILLGWGKSQGGGLGVATNSMLTPYIQPTPTTISSVSNVASAQALVSGGTVVLKRDGTVWILGDTLSYDFIAGTGTTSIGQVAGVSSIMDVGFPFSYGGVENIPLVSSSGAVSMLAWTAPNAFTYTGTTYTSSSTVTSVAGLPAMAKVACAGGTSIHCIGLSQTGTVWAWGLDNAQGQLGVGDTLGRTLPVQIPSLLSIVQVATSQSTSYALAADGSVYSWGGYLWGGLGYTASGNVLNPQKIPGLSSVVELGVGATVLNNSMLARKSDGTVWAWGSNAYGELGTGTTGAVTTPTQMPGINLN